MIPSWPNSLVRRPPHSMIESELLIKKVTPKILSKYISRMPMGSLVGH